MPTFHLRRALGYILAFILSATCVRVQAFSLLGPFQPWMTYELGFHNYGQLGGPVNIGEGYRWNVPYVTYGFDQSFLGYFGSNGVAAVEQAIQTMNALPPAAAVDLNTFVQNQPLSNPDATALNYLDLRSAAMSYLPQFMGLASASDNAFVLRSRTVILDTTNYTVVMRNFDPDSYAPTNRLLLGQIFTYTVVEPLHFLAETGTYTNGAFVIANVLGVGGSIYSTVAGKMLPAGQFFPTELSRDDVGGLRYLLSYGNSVFEPLLPDVRGAGPNVSNWVNEALRPGVEKVTFVRQTYNPLTGGFIPCTNRYTDAYFDGPNLKRQELERVTLRPDILFTAREMLVNGNPQMTLASGCTNWLNLSAQNGNPGGAGPGIIRPPMELAFNTLGPNRFNYSDAGASFLSQRFSQIGPSWATIMGSSGIIAYPQARSDGTPTHLRLKFVTGLGTQDAGWYLYGAPNSLFQLQYTADLVNWTNSVLVTNTGQPLTFILPADNSLKALFYRALPQ